MSATKQMSVHTAVSTGSNSTATLADLHDHLDNLWISYLHNLSEYTNAQALLQNHMSTGFLLLARANFNPRSGVRRYGKDYFSDRAVASKRVKISALDNDEKLKVDVATWTDDSEDAESGTSGENANEAEALERSNEQQPSPSLTPTAEVETGDTNEYKDSLDELKDRDGRESSEELSANHGTAATKVKPNMDPLRWFGILVPPELRSAQASFVLAIDEAVANALNASKRMRELEIEIRKLRKDIRKAEKVVN